MSSLLVIAIGFVSTIVLASLGDAATMAFGGSSIHTLSIFGLILFWVGLGARDSDRSDRALQTCAWICVGTLLLLWAAPILSAWFASPLPSFQAFLGLGFLSVLFATPLRWLGRHLCARVQAHAPRSWNQVAFGVWLALVFISLLGVGPIVFSIACAALTLLWLFPFPLPNPRILSAPHAKLIQLMPLAFIVASGTFGLLWLLPHLELFDSSTTNLDGLRITTMAIAVLVGGIMIGAPLAETNFAAIGVSILSSCLAWSWTRAAQQLDHLSDEKVFRLMVGNDGVLSFFGLQDRLTEEHWAFAPYLVLLVGMVSLGLLGGITRALFHQTLLDKKDAISAEGPISILFLASGLTLVLSAAAHPWLTEFRPIAAWVCALFAVIFCLSTCPREIPLWIRGCVGIFLLSFPVFAGTPRQPNTGHPFADNFSYKVLPLSNDKEVLYSPLSVVRIIDRNAAKRLGNRFLAKGKNFLLDNKDDGGLSVREALVACALGNPSGRFLLAGSSRPETIEALNRIGPKDLLVVSDPPELFQAISSSWDGASGTRTPPYRATIADAGAEFGLVLLQDSAIWDGGQNLLRSSQLSVAASKVKQDGVLAVVMNPDKSPIELVGAVAKQLERDLGSAVVWLIPNGWGTPSLVITGREKRVGARLTKRLKNALAQAKLPIQSNDDLSMLQVVPKGKVSELPSFSIAGPFPRSVHRLAHTAYKRIDEGESDKRAATLLKGIVPFAEGTPAEIILSFYAEHLSGQVYEVRDTFPGAEEWEKTELSKASLDYLFRGSVQNPSSVLLRDFWVQLTPLLVEKREVNWCFEYMSSFCDPAQFPEWDRPVFHWALGSAALEMLDYERAISEAQLVLRKNPANRRGLILLAQAKSGTGQNAEAADAYRKLLENDPSPKPELWAAIAGEELAAGFPDKAKAAAEEAIKLGGEEVLGRDLRALMGLLPPEPIAHPEQGGPLR